MVHTFQLPSSRTLTGPDADIKLGIFAKLCSIPQLPNISGDLCNVDLFVPISSTLEVSLWVYLGQVP